MGQANLAAKRGKKLCRDHGRGPIGAIDHDLLAGKVQPGYNVAQKPLIFLAESLVDRGRALLFEIGRERFLKTAKDFCLNLHLRGVGQLVAIAAEYLDPVVLPGVVRGGNHDPGGELMLARQVGHARRGDHPGVQHLRAPAAQSCGDHSRDPGAGFPGIRAQQHLGLGAKSLQRGCQRDSHGENSGRVQRRLAGDRTNTVRSKKFSHELLGGNFLSSTRLVSVLLANRVLIRAPS